MLTNLLCEPICEKMKASADMNLYVFVVTTSEKEINHLSIIKINKPVNRNIGPFVICLPCFRKECPILNQDRQVNDISLH